MSCIARDRKFEEHLWLCALFCRRFKTYRAQRRIKKEKFLIYRTEQLEKIKSRLRFLKIKKWWQKKRSQFWIIRAKDLRNRHCGNDMRNQQRYSVMKLRFQQQRSSTCSAHSSIAISARESLDSGDDSLNLADIQPSPRNLAEL